MGRFLGVSVGLVVVLAVVWFCSGNGFPTVPAQSRDNVPQFSSEPDPTQVPATAPEASQQSHTALTAKRLISFDGRTDEELTGVAALELWNWGDSDIAYAEVAVYQQDRELRFITTYIPAGGSVLVPEKDGSPYTQAAVTDFQCVRVIPMEEEDCGDNISVAESGAYSLTVTNLTRETVDCVRVFYKQYDTEGDFFVGGTTYCVVIPNLAAGESRELTPYRYAAGDTKVVAVTTEP